jgi:hypothetical protein
MTQSFNEYPQPVEDSAGRQANASAVHELSGDHFLSSVDLPGLLEQ